MSDTRNFTLGAAAIAATILVTITVLFEMTSASAQQLKDIEPMRASEPVALYITLCLWSEHRPAAICREVSLTPGAAGPGFASMEACQDGQEEAMRRWLAEAGPVFGFTALAGDGYRIEGRHCRPIMGSPSGRE
jgi:hypothetical protein